MPYQLPLFPLPDVVLFPRVALPLHVFEPRYRAMVEAAMEGERRIGIVQLRDGYEDQYLGTPPIFRILTAARILDSERLKDGRWNLILEGVERVQLLEETQKDPYRIALVEPLVEEILQAEADEVDGLMRTTAAMAENLGSNFRESRRILNNLVNTHQHPSIVADLIAAVLVVDPYARQSLLAERNILRRFRLLRVQLQGLAVELASRRIPLDTAEPES